MDIIAYISLSDGSQSEMNSSVRVSMNLAEVAVGGIISQKKLF